MLSIPQPVKVGCATVITMIPVAPRLMLPETGALAQAVPWEAAEMGLRGFSVRAVINYKPPKCKACVEPQTKESSVCPGERALIV